MKKKVVSLLLATTMVASLAAGCGDSSSSGDGTLHQEMAQKRQVRRYRP